MAAFEFSFPATTTQGVAIPGVFLDYLDGWCRPAHPGLALQIGHAVATARRFGTSIAVAAVLAPVGRRTAIATVAAAAARPPATHSLSRMRVPALGGSGEGCRR